MIYIHEVGMEIPGISILLILYFKCGVSPTHTCSVSTLHGTVIIALPDTGSMLVHVNYADHPRIIQTPRGRRGYAYSAYL